MKNIKAIEGTNYLVEYTQQYNLVRDANNVYILEPDKTEGLNYISIYELIT